MASQAHPSPWGAASVTSSHRSCDRLCMDRQVGSHLLLALSIRPCMAAGVSSTAVDFLLPTSNTFSHASLPPTPLPIQHGCVPSRNFLINQYDRTAQALTSSRRRLLRRNLGRKPPSQLAIRCWSPTNRSIMHLLLSFTLHSSQLVLC